MDKIIINVGRQIGSGGRTIAAMLADDFAAKMYDKELLNLAARESGFSEKFFEQNDEHKGLLQGLFHTHLPYIGDNGFYNNNFSQEGLFKFQADAMRKAAAKGSCVFVGRCADYVLRDMDHVVNVFITAPMEHRISRVAERDHLSEVEAKKVIERGEAQRASYYNYYTGKQWGHSSSYDLCIDSTRLGLEGTELLIARFIRDGQWKLKYNG